MFKTKFFVCILFLTAKLTRTQLLFQNSNVFNPFGYSLSAYENPLVYLTISDNPLQIHVNINARKGNYTATVREAGKTTTLPASLAYDLSSFGQPDIIAYSIALPQGKTQLEYQLLGLEEDKSLHTINFSSKEDKITVCLFGDYTSEIEGARIDISKHISNNKCSLNVVVGRVPWQETSQGLVYNSFAALSSANYNSLAEVPSLLGVGGSYLKESTYFQSTELNGVAFIQCSATIATTARLVQTTDQFAKVTEYFRETMLNELECKLQELHSRKNKPWIVIYLTHLYDESGKILTLILNDDSIFAKRFFELIKRYKIDLLASCGNFGMPEMFAKHQLDFPNELLPKYFRVSFSGFGSAGCSDNASRSAIGCNFVVLQVDGSQAMLYTNKGPTGKVYESGKINKNEQEPEKCAEKEL